jgi:MFS family permease
MEQQGKALGLLFLTIFFWYWILGTLIAAVLFIDSWDPFYGIVFLIALAFTILYAFLLKRFRTLREATDEFWDQSPPVG